MQPLFGASALGWRGAGVAQAWRGEAGNERSGRAGGRSGTGTGRQYIWVEMMEHAIRRLLW
jgi:hypothetical protein